MSLNVIQIEAHHVKVNKYVLMKGYACKVVDVKISKTGKHGHAKVNFTGSHLFSDRKFNLVFPGHISVKVPEVKNKTYLLMDFTKNMDGTNPVSATLSLLTENDEEHEITQKYPESGSADLYKVMDDIFTAFENNESVNITTVTAPEGETEPYKEKEFLKGMSIIND